MSRSQARLNKKTPPHEMSLLDCAELLEKFLVYQISKDQKSGDDEGANLKGYTLAMVRQTIVRAKATNGPHP